MLQTNVLGHPILQRVLSIYITRLLLPTRVTATQVTVVMFLVGLLASALVVFGWIWTGFVMLYLSILLDATDGEVARYRRISSLRSIYMDLINHLATQSFFFLAVAYWVSQELVEPWQTLLLVCGALGAIAFPLRRANGELHQVMYVRPFTDPGLYTLDYVHAPESRGRAVSSKISLTPFGLIRLTIKGVYEMHQLAPMLIAFAVALAAQQTYFPTIYSLPPIALVLLAYTATSSIYLVREVWGTFYAIDSRVHQVRDKLDDLRHQKDARNG